MKRGVVVVGYADERNRKMRQSKVVSAVVGTTDELESEEKGLDESLWLAYETEEGKPLASIKDAQAYLHHHKH